MVGGDGDGDGANDNANGANDNANGASELLSHCRLFPCGSHGRSRSRECKRARFWVLPKVSILLLPYLPTST